MAISTPAKPSAEVTSLAGYIQPACTKVTIRQPCSAVLLMPGLWVLLSHAARIVPATHTLPCSTPAASPASSRLAAASMPLLNAITNSADLCSTEHTEAHSQAHSDQPSAGMRRRCCRPSWCAGHVDVQRHLQHGFRAFRQATCCCLPHLHKHVNASNKQCGRHMGCHLWTIGEYSPALPQTHL